MPHQGMALCMAGKIWALKPDTSSLYMGAAAETTSVLGVFIQCVLQLSTSTETNNDLEP